VSSVASASASAARRRAASRQRRRHDDDRGLGERASRVCVTGRAERVEPPLRSRGLHAGAASPRAGRREQQDDRLAADEQEPPARDP
jgi:hypothetical protein